MPYTTHQQEPTVKEDCKRFEVHTAEKGDGSDTGNFQHPNQFHGRRRQSTQQADPTIT